MSNVCWACGIPDAKVFCPSCHKIQAPGDADAFQRLHIPYSFDVDLNLLQQKYFQAQHLVHPDRYTNAKDPEKRFAQEQAETINKAYQQLKDPIYRAQILLGQHHHFINATAQEVLMATLVWHEKIAEAKTPESLQTLLDQINVVCNMTSASLNSEFETGKIVNAPILAGTLQYLLKVRQQLIQMMRGDR
jgi:molecular chaperone HscB